MRQYGMKKYHTDVFFPPLLRRICQAQLAHHAAAYTLSNHAREQLLARALVLPATLPLDAAIIEATTDFGSLEKFLIRFEHTRHEDIVVGVTIDGVITTVFWNLRNDHHFGLRRDQYVQAA